MIKGLKICRNLESWISETNWAVRLGARQNRAECASWQCAPIKDSDQTAQMRSLIWVFDGCSMGSQGSNISTKRILGLIRLCRCTTNFNLYCTHMRSWKIKICWIPAKFQPINQITGRLENSSAIKHIRTSRLALVWNIEMSQENLHYI